jgi:carboxylesterase type B
MFACTLIMIMAIAQSAQGEVNEPKPTVLPFYPKSYRVYSPTDRDAASMGLILALSQGYIRGFINSTAPRTRQFTGIPFADSPIGNKRLMPPFPASPWNQQNPNMILETTGIPPACIQPKPIVQSEDCLFVNVFAPTLDRIPQQGLPVLVWIHGGAFLFGSSIDPKLSDSEYIPDTKDVILVSLQYRLGALGLMTTSEIQPNLALLDQAAALKWISDNIRTFGGDPTRITIMGQSAGAMSVGFHLTSDLSTGLYSRAIMHVRS